ncbi:MAG: metallophosphoesterase [Silicimonas sp.]|nr:metallophosphoesterase [Silicimonas sp.]
MISDLNGSYGSVTYPTEVHRAMQEIIRLDPDVVISTGDMVAGQRRPHLTESEVRAMWRGFHAAVTEPLEKADIPFLVTPGNHDASAYGGFEGERGIFRDEWSPRAPKGIEGDWPFAYSIRTGGARFISLDATTVGSLPAGQMNWLNDLGDDGGPTIVFSHLPLHPFAQERETEIIGDPALDRALHSIGADLYLSGHHHAFYPGSRDDIAFVGQACLGGGARRLIGQDRRAAKGFTVIDMESGRMTVMGLNTDTFAPVDLQSLPQRIADLRRLDIEPTNLVSAAR